MKRKWLLTIGILSVMGCSIVGCSASKTGDSTKNRTDNADHEGINKYASATVEEVAEALNSEEFNFIYNINVIPEDWWNLECQKIGSTTYSNKETYELRLDATVDTVNGEHITHPDGFSRTITEGDTELTVTLEDNDFIYSRNLMTTESPSMYFYVFGDDVHFYEINFSAIKGYVSEVVKEQVTSGEWCVIVEEDEEQSIEITAYYALEEDWYAKLEFPDVMTDEYWESIADDEDAWLEEPYREADIMELAERVTSLISFELNQSAE